jgi:uncharacterized protein YjdB
MKRIISLLLCISLVFTMIPAVFAADDDGLTNFQKIQTYEDGHFTDVPTTQWYASNVKAAYEYGLINGTSTSTYSPNGQVTVAATLALACRLHDIYYGGTGAFTEGAPWYQVYVDYAISYGIISDGQFGNYNAVITRAQFAQIMAKALPAEALPAINNIDVGSLPDVPATAAYASSVYTLYNAGILTGNDSYGTFTPDSSIKRSEVATILVRMADKSQRKSFVPAVSTTRNVGLSNFQKTQTYEDGHFTDVPTTQWYAPNVKAAYEYGLINGTSASTYTPNGQVTVAATLALACRLHDIYYGGTGAFKEGTPWYQVYVDYAISNGIISDGQFGNYNAVITRAQFAQIMAKALPAEALPAINNIDVGSLPDVPATAAYASSVYALYNAGILTGNDSYGTFTPDSSIKRSEVATILVRMADKSQRKSFVPVSTISVTSVEMVGSTWTLTVGTPFTYTATVLPENATNKAVTWTSSDPSVATVSASGTVTPLKSGTVVITVSSANGKTSSRQITVKHTGSDTFNYLVSQIKSNGDRLSSKLYNYSYSGNIPRRTYDLAYSLDTNKITLKAYYDDIANKTFVNIYFTQSLETPYNVSAWSYNVYGRTYDMSADLYPSTYSSSTILKNKNSTYTSSSMSKLETESSALAYKALKLVDDNILKPAGYSLKDLGFKNL